MATRHMPLSILIAICALAACEDPSELTALPDLARSRAEVTTENGTDLIDLALDCTAAGGEIVDLSGTLHFTVTTVVKEGFVHATLTSNAQGMSGIGRSTGDTYRAPGMGLDMFKFRTQPSGESFNATFHDLTHLVRTGAGGGAGRSGAPGSAATSRSLPTGMSASTGLISRTAWPSELTFATRRRRGTGDQHFAMANLECRPSS